MHAYDEVLVGIFTDFEVGNTNLDEFLTKIYDWVTYLVFF